MYKCQLKTNSYTNQEGKTPVTVQYHIVSDFTDPVITFNVNITFT